MEYRAVDRPRSETSGFADGRAGIQEHPLEPITARIAFSKRF
jgi:hypothetical protein